MKNLKNYLLFKKFMMPFVLQFLFWGGIGGVLYGSYWLYTNDNWAWIMALVFGILVTRLIFESLIIRYQTYICLRDIKNKLDEK
ncbi:hypothetical protein [Muriicola sp. Z0-33]|uniref:hypothetical protein n=1 Tax=Muriicola sp. Z0-33 TaxID=2816957 RepID=UPI0022379614|nr:hypothetical protein [Muriicola sp. Z0-33]